MNYVKMYIWARRLRLKQIKTIEAIFRSILNKYASNEINPFQQNDKLYAHI